MVNSANVFYFRFAVVNTIGYNYLLYLYSAFLGNQIALHKRGGGGESPQPPPMCSIILDDVTGAI